MNLKSSIQGLIMGLDPTQSYSNNNHALTHVGVLYGEKYTSLYSLWKKIKIEAKSSDKMGF